MSLTRASGVLLHPTSLPGSHGSGDLGAAAYHFVDWLQSAGQKLWQILPLGGIGPGNSPYMSSSAFAGNVLLVDLRELQQQGWLGDEDLKPDAAFSDQRIRFSAVLPWRMERLQKAAATFTAAASPEQRQDFQEFCVLHAVWLHDYALFMTLADSNGWALWSDWDPLLAGRDETALRAAGSDYAHGVLFWQFCQWRFFRQWKKLKAYA